MLTAHHISKSFDISPILHNISFTVQARERVGLIGPNGCGKTTLLRILSGREEADAGTITLTPVTTRIGYLSQGFELEPNQSGGEFWQQLTGNPAELEDKLGQLATQLADDPGRDDLQTQYDQTLSQLSQLGSGREQTILASLELDNIPLPQKLNSLSGGQKTRLSLALLLLQQPDLLLLDEPTNHLDIEMLEWLEDWLTVYPGGVLMASHDRAFLDNTVTKILDLNPYNHTIQEYVGNYSDYLEQFVAEQQRQWAGYRDQQAEIRRMKRDIQQTMEQARWVERTTTPRTPGVRRYAKKVAKKGKSREKKLERYLDSEERLEKPDRSWQMKLEFTRPEHLGRAVLSLEEVAIGYPGFSPLLTNLHLQIPAGARVVLTGANGSGKSTLLRTIMGHLPPLSGRVRLGGSVRPGYMSQEQEQINPNWSALEHIQQVAPLNDTEARSFLHYFLFTGDAGVRPGRELSFGERTRLSLALLVAQGCNFLILDEPINHLDIPSRSRFEESLTQFNGTVLAVVHDRYFIDRFATAVWAVNGQTITF